MSKGSRKSSRKAEPAPQPVPSPAAAAPAAKAVSASATGSLANPPADAGTSWLDSSDPRRRMWGKIVLVGIWLYVAALWLLALDQTFNWGIFGPKVPIVP